MHPAPSLAEAPPKTEEPRNGQHQPASPESQGRQTQSASPPVRKDTTSSTSTTATAATLATIASTDSAGTAYSVEPATQQYASQAIFSIKDGNDVKDKARISRRRTGPLSAVQRERAALIRKLGACSDCRRRRVACHPNHHNMTWEDAARKYRSHSPNLQELAPLAGRPLSPAPLSSKSLFTHDPQDMDIDPVSSQAQQSQQQQQQQQPGRPPAPMSESRIRTPLPSGPRLEKSILPAPLPSIDALKADLQGTASSIISNSIHGRYSSAHALLLYWQEDDDAGVRPAVEDLASVLEQSYNYTFEIKPIPASSDGCKSAWRWLSREVTEFIDNRDQRDVLKVVYYNGHAHLDSNREFVLASSRNPETATTIRWSGIQQILEDACSDNLLIMDAAYYPSSRLVRQQGVLEVIAAAGSEDHVKFLDRNAFTRAMTDQLHTRASQKFMSPLSAAELHAKLLSHYPKMVHDRRPEQVILSFPCPVHIQVSGNAKLPSILLAPLPPRGQTYRPESPQSGQQLSLIFRLTDDAVNMESWAEWLRLMPEGVRDVKVDGPFRNTLR